MTVIHDWHKYQLDCFVAFAQAPMERELYIQISKELDLQNKLSCDHVLKLHRNTYAQKMLVEYGINK